MAVDAQAREYWTYNMGTLKEENCGLSSRKR
jgi:hypothetical protein